MPDPYPKPERRAPRRRGHNSTLSSAVRGLRPFSKKGREQKALWDSERDAHLETHPSCEFFRFAGAALKAQGGLTAFVALGHAGPLDVHHRWIRGMGGRRGPAGPLLTLCRKHHDWTHEHSEASEALGLLVRKGGQP